MEGSLNMAQENSTKIRKQALVYQEKISALSSEVSLCNLVSPCWPWLPLAVLGRSWQSLAVLGSPWQYLAVLGSPRQFLARFGTPWYALVRLGAPWYALVHLGTPWYALTGLGRPWQLLGALIELVTFAALGRVCNFHNLCFCCVIGHHNNFGCLNCQKQAFNYEEKIMHTQVWSALQPWQPLLVFAVLGSFWLY
jgi:hypothetical protein